MEIKIFNFLTKNVSYLILGLYEMINIHKTYCGLKKKKRGRDREVKELTHGQIAGKWWSRNLKTLLT